MDGTARDAIAGFTRAEGQYNEAIKYPTERYHRTRKVVEEHIRALIESHALKEGDARVLRRIHTLNILELSRILGIKWILLS